ncbi:MAG: gamma-glutamyltransferase, partial [Saprospiraceae bacterium]
MLTNQSIQNVSRNQSLQINKWILLALLLSSSLIIACRTSKLTVLPHIDKTSTGKNGMVVSAHSLASQVGLDILQAGGNAIDASVAVQFALAVVYPNAGNIGGGGFLILRTADGSMLSLDYRETAPHAANSKTFLDEKGEVITDKSYVGHNSAAVPGTVAGMWELHQKYGKLPWKKLVQASIDLAKKGYSIDAREAKLLNDNLSDFKQYNTQDNAYENTKAWNEGDLLVLKDLAVTLERIRDLGTDGFYKGATAEAIVAEMKRGKGIITLQDLLDYKPKWRAPVIGQFNEYTVITLAPPSSGGIILMQVLGMIDAFGLDKIGMNEPKSMTVMAEAEKIAFADRATHLGDPDFYHVPEEALLNPKYLKSRAALINPNLATPSDQISSGISAPKHSEQTTHYSIADKKGNVVSVTTSLNNNFGSKVV